MARMSCTDVPVCALDTLRVYLIFILLFVHEVRHVSRFSASVCLAFSLIVAVTSLNGRKRACQRMEKL